MYTIEEIERIRTQVMRQRLKVSAEFWTISDAALQQICNGYGPDRWPEALRKIMTWIFRHYQESAVIHDVRYEYSDGTSLGRNLADHEFLENLKLQWRRRYGGFRFVNPAALYGRLKIWSAFVSVQKFGGPAYLTAFTNRS